MHFVSFNKVFYCYSFTFIIVFYTSICYHLEKIPDDVRPTVTAVKFQDQEIKEGEPLELIADIAGYPTPTIEWYRGSTSLSASKRVLISHEKSSYKLRISKASLEDAGEYKIVATNKVASASYSADITVKAKGTKPKFTKELADVEVDDLESIVFEVEVPNADSVSWFLDDLAVSDDEDFEFTQKGNRYSYKIKQVNPEDSGKYECRATNKHGTTVSSCQLVVNEIADKVDGKDGKPVINVDLPEDGFIEREEGQDFELNFDVSGEPAPEVFFYKDDDPLEDDNGRAVITRMGRTYRFFIPDLKKSDSGIYVIEAEIKYLT